MQVRLLKKGSSKFLKLTFILIIVLSTVVAIYFPTYFRYARLKKENRKMMKKVEKLKTEIKELEKNIRDLKEAPYLLEKMVRENLGAAKDDEIVIDIRE